MNLDLPARLKTRLKETLPGEKAQYLMAPFYRKSGSFREVDLTGYRASAVMVLLCQRGGGEWFIPLTLRNEYQGVHSAQVSLPGGKKDEEDMTLADTALRECKEEIGISKTVELLGELTALHIPTSKFIVHPFVAVNHSTEIHYISHEREVNAIIELPLKVLLEDSAIVNGEVPIGPGQVIVAPYFSVQGQKVWGATAMILSELKYLIKEQMNIR